MVSSFENNIPLFAEVIIFVVKLLAFGKTGHIITHTAKIKQIYVGHIKIFDSGTC